MVIRQQVVVVVTVGLAINGEGKFFILFFLRNRYGLIIHKLCKIYGLIICKFYITYGLIICILFYGLAIRKKHTDCNQSVRSIRIVNP